MKDYQKEFIRFLIEAEALRFGEFTLKSGRKSPYFFNSGAFDTGAKIEKLGYYYACRIRDLEPPPSLLFGPAYKGIPLVVATATALHRDFRTDLPYCFDRKEEKTHGDRGLLVGHVPTASDRIAIIDDVVTNGATKLEAIERLRGMSEARVTDVIIALNRLEKTEEGEDPIAKIEEMGGVQVSAIATIDDALAAFEDYESGGSLLISDEMRNRVRAYRNQFAVEKGAS